jgi:3',5'-cyclic AMP phosphodiesterase CpdA
MVAGAVGRPLAAGNRTEGGTPPRGGRFVMAVASDIHFLAPELRDNGKAFRDFAASGDGRQLDAVGEIVEAFARDVSRLAPDVVVVSGDLTSNGEKPSHLALARTLAGIERASGTHVFVVPGNHDILNPWARKFVGDRQYAVDSITRDEFRTIYREFGYDEALSADSSSLSYLVAPSEHTWILMLDTCEYRFNRALGRPGTRGVIGPATLDWIRQSAERAKERGAQIVTVMHHNLVDHNELLHGGYTLDNSAEVQRLFASLGLHLVFSGHLHVQDIRRIDASPVPTYDIATSALSVFPQQYGVIEFLPSGAADYRTSRVDVEGWARSAGVRQKSLREFGAFSETRFVEASYKKTYAALTAARSYSTRNKKLMAETMSRLNAHYFAGTAATIRDAVMASEGYRLWVAATEPAFLKRYVMSMVGGPAADHTHLRIDR